MPAQHHQSPRCGDHPLVIQWFHFPEAGPHLLLQVFLQRTVNGGVRIERECSADRGRTDLLIAWLPLVFQCGNAMTGNSSDE